MSLAVRAPEDDEAAADEAEADDEAEPAAADAAGADRSAESAATMKAADLTAADRERRDNVLSAAADRAPETARAEAAYFQRPKKEKARSGQPPLTLDGPLSAAVRHIVRADGTNEKEDGRILASVPFHAAPRGSADARPSGLCGLCRLGRRRGLLSRLCSGRSLRRGGLSRLRGSGLRSGRLGFSLCRRTAGAASRRLRR